MIDEETVECGCGRFVDEIFICPTCKLRGCSNCMIQGLDSGEYFCDTGNTGKLEDSECFEAYIKPAEKKKQTLILESQIKEEMYKKGYNKGGDWVENGWNVLSFYKENLKVQVRIEK